MGMSNQWSNDPRELLRPGADFDLATFDRRGTPGWEGDKAEAKELMDSRGALLYELQERLYAEGRAGGKRSVLIIVQGLDTAGKGGIARHVMGYVDPQGVQLRSFGVPTEEERSHHYLWRIEKALPQPGRIGLFDRSHYEDVLVVRVDELVEQEVWEPRYDEINAWEKELADSGTIILKFALMVSHEEQGLRLMERLDRPDKHWKYSPSDLTTRANWDKYQQAYQAVFERTDTDHAPWYVLPADRKWYSRLAATEIITRTLIEMEMTWPRVRWSDDVQRRKLADTMTTASLAESLAATEETVRSAIEESIDVKLEAAALVGRDEETTRELADAKRQELLAELEQNIAHKRELLAARDDAPSGSEPAEQDSKKSKKSKESGKGGGKGKKKKKSKKGKK
ncbi:polyphosphate kinase 2 family protein [Tessaracoccus rhinocerotis]|uniref:Polyphosphate kinase 2 family protein n=2 Tax=Tessaracoccus rhinocerotis TaxID=1689449 RepID=A0A553JZ37_9ACTN|nr:polyphosphate kinase 2 family protein [Tessaracoccus rhinocerotis]